MNSTLAAAHEPKTIVEQTTDDAEKSAASLMRL